MFSHSYRSRMNSFCRRDSSPSFPYIAFQKEPFATSHTVCIFLRSIWRVTRFVLFTVHFFDRPFFGTQRKSFSRFSPVLQNPSTILRFRTSPSLSDPFCVQSSFNRYTVPKSFAGCVGCFSGRTSYAAGASTSLRSPRLPVFIVKKFKFFVCQNFVFLRVFSCFVFFNFFS